LRLSSSALDKISEGGFDPVYGAVPLKRVIRQQLQNLLAQEILKGTFKPGDSIVVSVSNGELSFNS